MSESRNLPDSILSKNREQSEVSHIPESFKEEADLQKESQFLSTYDASEYAHPSVTVDILVFTFDVEEGLSILLIKRNVHPFKNSWALPGGFIQIDESLEESARRVLLRETGIQDIHMEQLYTFGKVDRDPRTRVISVAYLALMPYSKAMNSVLAKEASWCKLSVDAELTDTTLLKFEDERDLAFDHEQILSTAIERLQGKLSYTDLAFHLLKDDHRFAIYELQKIYERIYGHKLDTPNFRRMFQANYIKTGKVSETGEKCTEYAGRSSKYYDYHS